MSSVGKMLSKMILFHFYPILSMYITVSSFRTCSKASSYFYLFHFFKPSHHVCGTFALASSSMTDLASLRILATRNMISRAPVEIICSSSLSSYPTAFAGSKTTTYWTFTLGMISIALYLCITQLAFSIICSANFSLRQSICLGFGKHISYL